MRAPGKNASGVLTETSAADRRRRRRIKMSAPIRVRSYGSNETFEEIAITADVSRDGILFVSPRLYSRGLQVAVTFPYSPHPTAINTEQVAEVVRTFEQPGGMFGVAVHLLQSVPASAWTEASIQSSNAGQGFRSVVANRPLVVVTTTDIHMREQIKTILNARGYAVALSENSLQALKEIHRSAPALIMADCELPDVVGSEFCRMLKNDPMMSRIPFVLLVSAGSGETAAQGLSQGALVCLERPIEEERLIKIVTVLAPLPKIQDNYVGHLGSSKLANDSQR
ncbi:MAG: response regulator [Candidatus Acidiferrales bacterium]